MKHRAIGMVGLGGKGTDTATKVRGGAGLTHANLGVSAFRDS